MAAIIHQAPASCQTETMLCFAQNAELHSHCEASEAIIPIIAYARKNTIYKAVESAKVVNLEG
jgi:hypothetical protein